MCVYATRVSHHMHVFLFDSNQLWSRVDVMKQSAMHCQAFAICELSSICAMAQ